jgi:hypothetical protein
VNREAWVGVNQQKNAQKHPKTCKKTPKSGEKRKKNAKSTKNLTTFCAKQSQFASLRPEIVKREE